MQIFLSKISILFKYLRNIFLTSDYHAKLGDLGSGRKITTTDNLKGGISTIAGTRYFMPPEDKYTYNYDVW